MEPRGSVAARDVQRAERPARARLQAAVVPVAAVDAATRAAAWRLFDAAYAGAEQGRFEHDFADKSLVILLRDPVTGVLQGFSTVHVDESEAGTVVFSGDTVIAPPYWGTKALQQAFAGLLVRLKLRRPGQPLFWLLISKGYKTYLMLAHAFPRAIPRQDRHSDPELQRVLDCVAAARFGSAYDPATGLIRHHQPLEAVRAGVCPIDDALLTDPDIAFFAARNPGHARGDELACLAEVRLRDLVRKLARTLARRLARGGAR